MAVPTKVFFDGGCRPNPGAMEIAVVTGGREYLRQDAGYGASMDAEWFALIFALDVARDCGLTDFVLLGDAMGVINQANGRTKARGNAVGHLDAFRRLAGERTPRVRYVKRSQNLAGIALDRRRQ